MIRLTLITLFLTILVSLPSLSNAKVILNEGNFRVGQRKQEIINTLTDSFKQLQGMKEKDPVVFQQLQDIMFDQSIDEKSKKEKLEAFRIQVGLTQQEFLDHAFQLARGLGIISFYQTSYQCVVNTSVLFLRYQSALANFNNDQMTEFDAWLEFTLTLGNTSRWYKDCYSNSEDSILQLYYYVMDYDSVSNYLIYFLPNLLSYAFVINSWIDKMAALQKIGNTTGLMYYYGLIIRNIFFFPMPEAGALQSSSVGDEYRDLNQYRLEAEEQHGTKLEFSEEFKDRFYSEFTKKLQDIMQEINKNSQSEDKAQNDWDEDDHEGCEETVAHGSQSIHHIRKYYSLQQTATNATNSTNSTVPKLYSLWDYTVFSYYFTYNLLNAMWTYHANSYFQSCNTNVQNMSTAIILFQNYSTTIGTDSFSFRETTFSFATIFEYLYPISSFCNSARGEVATDTEQRFDVLTRNPEQIFENILRKLGSIMMNTMTIPDCFNYTLDGECSGTKAGKALNFILYYD
eukprot:403352409